VLKCYTLFHSVLDFKNYCAGSGHNKKNRNRILCMASIRTAQPTTRKGRTEVSEVTDNIVYPSADETSQRLIANTQELSRYWCIRYNSNRPIIMTMTTTMTMTTITIMRLLTIQT